MPHRRRLDDPLALLDGPRAARRDGADELLRAVGVAAVDLDRAADHGEPQRPALYQRHLHAGMPVGRERAAGGDHRPGQRQAVAAGKGRQRGGEVDPLRRRRRRLAGRGAGGDDRRAHGDGPGHGGERAAGGGAGGAGAPGATSVAHPGAARARAASARGGRVRVLLAGGRQRLDEDIGLTPKSPGKGGAYGAATTSLTATLTGAGPPTL